ncbi:MAG: branched-chain amino acid ABC transporter substrate-binding protein [Elusimicrobia bacterium]|nr:branched-chain amino acid ABC transporter substrate-binding protein [Elusimicrobiota bacterium]
MTPSEPGRAVDKGNAWLGPVLLAGLLLAACGPGEPKTVRVAVAVPLSGPLASDGEGVLRAVQLAAAEAKPIEFPPTRIEVSSYDDKASPEEAVRVAEQIAADPEVKAVVGHLTSGCSLAASRVYAKAGIPMITPSATNPELTVQQTKPDWTWPRVVFRLPPADDIQGSFTAEFAYDSLNLRAFAVLHDGTPYGRGLAEEFAKRFAQLGGRVVASETVAKGATDFREVVEWAGRFKPDGIFFGGDYNEAGRIVKEARTQGLAAAFMTGDGAKAPEIFQIAGPAVHGAYFTVGGIPVEHLPSAGDFIEHYRQRFPDSQPRTFDHFAYEATRIILEALAVSLDRRKPLLEVLRDIRHESMMGAIVFDHKGDTTKRIITVTRADFPQKRFKSTNPAGASWAAESAGTPSP